MERIAIKEENTGITLFAALNDTVAAKDLAKRLPCTFSGSDSGIDFCCIASSGNYDPAETQTGWKNGDISLGGGWFAVPSSGEHGRIYGPRRRKRLRRQAGRAPRFRSWIEMKLRRLPASLLPLYILCLLMVASCSAASDTAASAELRETLGNGDVQSALPDALPYDGVYPQHEPYGSGIGAMPGRVVWAHDPGCVEWDGNGYWWELSHFDETAIQDMVNDSIASLGGRETAQESWDALFRANRESRGKQDGYTAGEKIAIKANINGSAVMDDDTSGETGMSYTNPVLLKALITSLVEEAGVRPADITVYDVSRLFPDYMVELCTQGNLKGVRFVGRDNGVADENAPIQWSYPFNGKVNYLPTCVTETEYVINLANLKGHSYGITLCGKNHFGSFLNGNAMRPPEGANLHQWLIRNEMGIYSPLVDLMANADLGGKTVLYMLDAIICAPSEGASITGDNSRWQQAPFNGHYTASVFMSQDPVAIDSVGADFLMNEPAVTSRNGSLRDNPTVENYLHEAGMIGQPPSGTIYTDSQGHIVTNLGVHEHWNNSVDKQYSRNLGKNEGIELIYLKK